MSAEILNRLINKLPSQLWEEVHRTVVHHYNFSPTCWLSHIVMRSVLLQNLNSCDDTVVEAHVFIATRWQHRFFYYLNRDYNVNNFSILNAAEFIERIVKLLFAPAYVMDTGLNKITLLQYNSFKSEQYNFYYVLCVTWK